MAKKSLIKLKADCKKAQLKFNELLEAVQKAEDEIIIPKLKKQYEGKFFKYRNSSSGDAWDYYSFCKHIVDGRNAIVDCFQTTPYNEEFKINSKEYFHLFEKEITVQEYMNALTAFLSKVELMRSEAFNSGA